MLDIFKGLCFAVTFIIIALLLVPFIIPIIEPFFENYAKYCNYIVNLIN